MPSNILLSRRHALALGLGSAVLPWAARAQGPQGGGGSGDFPTKPIRLVVPFAPAGSTDILARLLSRQLFPHSGQPIVVENVAGAGGNLGAAVVARAPADGYTLEIGAMSTHAMNGSLYRQLPFDPMNDFDTVAMLAYAINVVAVSASMPVHTFPELLAYIRANPGKINYASGGIGTHNHLTLALLAKTAGLDIVHVPYKGGGPAVAALVQGECQMFAGGASLLLPHAQAGKIRLIAVTEKSRTDLLPGVPSVSETLKGFEVTNWYGVFAPRGLEPARRAQLNEEINRVTALPEVAERFRGLGMVRSPLSPLQLRAVLQADHDLWSRTIQSLRIAPE
ncbi:tripartite tricarboxylate transporter substrate-binding protein [Paracidovorax citrulli]|uniref:Bug family tripartite tricarboxylate transporter substrate binding protein n=1 Tax=Paracidovorax citrulli TaxID=80869 RepID=UPI00088EA11D|nr:tripartite tricarboxylate transporter substrate-binding protein [Paracidovorax citrulli]UMT87018.1 tripartite tricarboxylate transporter substrate binding protein [Paracidovorax citrulli]WIY34135.1 tripartite tricarboxylate transporter substrate-binding protein [Paracidovorax citrulli]SDJ18711.1 Tripartite-type tricarboxylate transporter, receptor component TctC [Paracidovorax citrulli]